MKKALIAIAVGVLAFVIGFVGLYMAMPTINPEVVEETHKFLDSLGVMVPLPPELGGEVDSLQSVYVAMDSMRAAKSLLEEAINQQKRVISGLEDSLSMATELLSALAVEQNRLLGKVDDLSSRIKSLESKKVDVKNLSATLPKLEDKDLSAIIQQLDTNVMEILYSEASDRNRTRFLQAMAPDRAATFVRQLVAAAPTVALPASVVDGQNDPAPTSIAN